MKKSVRQFLCPDDLWQAIEARAGELECSVDSLVALAIKNLMREPEPEPQHARPAAVPGPCLSMAPMGDPAPDGHLVISGLGASWVMRGDRFVIGSDASCDLTLEGPEIQARHAVIARLRGAHYVFDQGASAGILCNGQRIESKLSRRIVDRDELSIGEHRLTLRFIGSRGAP